MNYNDGNSPKELPGLKRAVQKIVDKHKESWENFSIYKLTENMVEIYSTHEENKEIQKEYIYDITNDKLYECGEKENYNGKFVYVEGMDSIIFVDNQLNSYKVKLQGSSYYLEKYIKLGEIFDSEEFSVHSPVKDEIRITKYRTVHEGKYSSITIKEILSIDKYDFSSNKLENLFEKKEGKSFRCLKFGGKDGISVFEEFKVEGDKVKFENRYVYKIIEGRMELVLIDNIANEGHDEYSITTANVSNDGKEVFIFSDKNARNYSNIGKSDELIYKRYRID